MIIKKFLLFSLWIESYLNFFLSKTLFSYQRLSYQMIKINLNDKDLSHDTVKVNFEIFLRGGKEKKKKRQNKCAWRNFFFYLISSKFI